MTSNTSFNRCSLLKGAAAVILAPVAVIFVLAHSATSSKGSPSRVCVDRNRSPASLSHAHRPDCVVNVNL